MQISTNDTTMRNTNIQIKKLPHFLGNLPAYETPHSSGMDVRAQIEKPMIIEPGKREFVPTGLAIAIPEGFEVQIRPRSGLAFKKGISVLNSPGTIDSDYRGEIKLILINHGNEPVTIASGDRVAQMVVCPVIRATFQEVDELSTTQRGAGGFGSTGVE